MTAARVTEIKPFNLALLVRTTMDQLDEPNPHRIAEQVVLQIPDTALRDALMLTMPDYVRKATFKVANPVMTARTTPTMPQRVASWYAAKLASPTFNGAEWKFLRDFTADDCHGAAAERYKAATATKIEGDKFTDLAELVESSGVGTVAGLSEPELRRVLGGAS